MAPSIPDASGEPDYRVRDVASLEAFAGDPRRGPDGANEPEVMARRLRRANPGLPERFARDFSAQAVALRGMTEGELRRRVAAWIVCAWRAACAQGRPSIDAFAADLGWPGPLALLAHAFAGEDDAAAQHRLAAGLSLAGTPQAGMPFDVRSRYDAVLAAGGRIDPAWGLLRAWLEQAPAAP